MAKEIDIRAENIGMTFKIGSEQIIALDSVSFEVKRGEFFCIVGPSGCGKTTLLRILIGLQKPSSGKVEVDCQRWKGGIAYIPQSSALLPWRTLSQNVSLGLEIKNSNNQSNTSDKHKKKTAETLSYQSKDLIKEYELNGFENHLPKELSGGMKRRADIVRTLTSDPNILFCDEPFSSIDFITRLKLSSLFRKRCKDKNMTTVIVTHNIEEAIFLGDRVAVMSKRPSRIMKIYNTILSKDPDDAVKSRQSPEFNQLFEKILNNLEGKYEEEH